MNVPTIMTPDGRRAWAFVVLWGACIVFTALALYSMVNTKNELHQLILGLAAHLQLFVAISAFSFVLGRRMEVKTSREGFEYSDKGQPDAKP